MKLSTTITTRILSGNLRPFLRHMSAAPATSDTAAPALTKESLFNTLFKVGSNGGQVANILHHKIRSGNRLPRFLLINCLKDLRKFRRYNVCLEILDWLEKGKYGLNDRDYALRLDILHKVKGLDEVEKCYNSIPSNMKTNYTYAALLHCYCTEPATDKALAIFSEMEEKGFVSSVVPFNSLLHLFLKVGQPERVPDLVADIKNKKISLSSHTYSYWMQSYQLLGDVEGVEQVFHEAEKQELVKSDSLIYSNVASICIELGQTEKAIAYLEKLEQVLDNSDEPHRIGYHHLMSSYANVGKLDCVLRAWNKFKSKLKVIHTNNYFTLLQALSKLDDIECLEKYFQEWESTCPSSYDDRLPATLISAYLKHDILQKAELFLEDCTAKAGKVLLRPHIHFMNYYFEKGDTDSALKYMEIAINSEWKPIAEKLGPCLHHFKARKDVDGAENFCRLLQRAQPLDAKTYSWLLQIYVEAGKTEPDMRRRMEKDGIDISPELEELLERVCGD